MIQKVNVAPRVYKIKIQFCKGIIIFKIFARIIHLNIKHLHLYYYFFNEKELEQSLQKRRFWLIPLFLVVNKRLSTNKLFSTRKVME